MYNTNLHQLQALDNMQNSQTRRHQLRYRSIVLMVIYQTDDPPTVKTTPPHASPEQGLD